MKNRKHIFIPLFVFIGACLVTLVWSIIDYVAINKTYSYSTEVLQLDFDGASEGNDPRGDAFNAADFLSDDVLEKALERSGLTDKYKVEDIKKNIAVYNVVPNNIVEEIESYESLIEVTNGREISSNDYFPVRYQFTLYQDLDYKLSAKKLNEILSNIVDCYSEKFYETFKKSYNAPIYDELFNMDGYDYIYQVEVYTNKIEVLSNYAKRIYQEHDDFKVEDKSFNDIYLRGVQLIESDISRINNIIILNALSKDLDRLKDYYEYKIETLNYEKTKKTSDLNAVTAQLASYKKDSTVYVGTGENVIKVDSNSEATYNALLNRQITLSNNISAINVEIDEYQSILTDINNANPNDSTYTLVQGYISKLASDFASLESNFNDMLDVYNEKYILKTSLSKGEVSYTSNSIISLSFIKRCLKIGAPILLFTLFGIGCFYVVLAISKERKAK